MKNFKYLSDLNWDNLTLAIRTGKTYNYRELCQLLNLKILGSGSNAQIKQLNELSMVCEYEKVNTKYKILSLRSQEEIALYQERAIFTPIIECALSETFLKLQQDRNNNIKDGILFFTMSMLMLWCGMVHKNYTFLRNGDNYKRIQRSSLISAKYQFDITDLYNFLDISYNKILKPIIRNALRAMDNKKSIIIQKGFKVYTHSVDKQITYKNILATDQEGQQIERIIANVYTEFGITNSQSFILSPKTTQRQIFDRCNELCNQQLGYDGFYDCYAVIINRYRTMCNLEHLQHTLNERIQDKLKDSQYLDFLTTHSKKQFIDTMINIDTIADFNNDFEEYYKLQFSS